jgi:hypothetical protein
MLLLNCIQALDYGNMKVGELIKLLENYASEMEVFGPEQSDYGYPPSLTRIKSLRVREVYDYNSTKPLSTNDTKKRFVLEISEWDK